MARALAVARVEVSAAREAEYLAVIGRLAALLKMRGQHLWIFRHPDDAGVFLEFREASDPAVHSAVAPTAEEAALVRVARGLAAYGPGADDLWLELSLAE